MLTKKAKCPICNKQFEGKYADGSLRLHLFRGHAAKLPPKEKEEKKPSRQEIEKKWRWLSKSDPREHKSYRRKRKIKVGQLVVYQQITIEEYLEGVTKNE